MHQPGVPREHLTEGLFVPEADGFVQRWLAAVIVQMT
jgi:hypothetical protein